MFLVVIRLVFLNGKLILRLGWGVSSGSAGVTGLELVGAFEGLGRGWGVGRGVVLVGEGLAGEFAVEVGVVGQGDGKGRGWVLVCGEGRSLS